MHSVLSRVLIQAHKIRLVVQFDFRMTIRNGEIVLIIFIAIRIPAQIINFGGSKLFYLYFLIKFDHKLALNIWFFRLSNSGIQDCIHFACILLHECIYSILQRFYIFWYWRRYLL